MSTCRCCGQHIEAAATASATANLVRVDERVLSLCNAAYEDAVRRQSAEVEIAHLAMVLGDADEAAQLFAVYGTTAADVTLAAQSWLRAWEQRGTADATVRTSTELKQLLAQAEARAQRDGRIYASLRDLASSLFEDAGELWSASFAAGLPASPFYSGQAVQRDTFVRSGPQPWGRDGGRAYERQERLNTSQHDYALREAMPSDRLDDRALSGFAADAESRRLDRSGDRMPRTPALSNDEETGGARYAFVAHAGSPASPAQDETAALIQAIAVRQEQQERQFLQRLDMQQRMLAELAEAFARSMQELASARTGTSQTTPSSSSQQVSRDSQSRSRRSRRSSRSRWRRQSWSQWRRTRARNLAPVERLERNLPAAVRLQDPETDATPDLAHIEMETEPGGTREKRFYLSLADDVEKAPSIGPRTASLLHSAGVMTVRDLLVCDPAAAAAKIGVRYITANRIARWQAQSRLVCTIPWLRGTHAQLLVGAGYDTIDAIAAADTASVCAAILKFAATSEGQSVLRNAAPPTMDWVALRLEHARAAEPERAAA